MSDDGTIRSSATDEAGDVTARTSASAAREEGDGELWAVGAGSASTLQRQRC